MKRKQHSAQFKARVALEALKGQKTVNQMAAEYGVHPTQISHWKRQLQDGDQEVFSSKRQKQEKEEEELKAVLYQEIGQLKVELDWLKRKTASGTEAKRTMIERSHPRISIRRQCVLLRLNRSSLDYPPTQETEENLWLMRLIDQQYTRTPFYGSRRVTNWLEREGHRVNRKRVQRLMRRMGLEAIYPRPRLSMAGPEHKVYPCLLRGM